MTSTGLTRRHFAAGGALLVTGCASHVSLTSPQPAATPATLTKVRVKVFPGSQNLPLLAGLQKGFFRKHGLDVDLQFTKTSVELRDDLARGAFQIVHTAVDNAAAMKDVAGHDVVIFMGGDNSMNEFFVQPDIASLQQVRGRMVAVDAPNTAYALQAKKILLQAGIKPNEYQLKLVGGTFQRVKAMIDDKSNSATMLNPPFTVQARAAGLRSLGRVSDLLGPYQGTGAIAMRAWAGANGPVLERYIAAYIESLRWATAPANRQEATDMLAKELKLTPAVAAQTYTAIQDPVNGLVRDAHFDAKGFDNVLKLRHELEARPGAPVPDPARYVDMRWYNAALAQVGRG
jgi:ABC-type nitrate/sulfonate/bicarbonate transport system substrate-binding protein